MPDVRQWAIIAVVGGFERGVIRCAPGIRVRFENDAGKIHPAENFAKKQPDSAPVEVAERMNGEKATFDEAEQFESEVGQRRGRIRPARLKIERVVAHPQRELVRKRWLEIADADLDRAPPAGPIGNEVAADAGVQIEKERFVERARREGFPIKVRLRDGDPRREERSERRVAQGAASGFNKAGGSIRARIARICSTGTGSLSKAMLRATSSGIVSQRSCSLRFSGRRCQRWIWFCQFIGHRCNPPSETAQPLPKQRQSDRATHGAAKRGPAGSSDAQEWQRCSWVWT